MSTGREFPESGREKALSRPAGKFKSGISGISGISGQNQSSNYGKIVHTFRRNFQRFFGSSFEATHERTADLEILYQALLSIAMHCDFLQ